MKHIIVKSIFIIIVLSAFAQCKEKSVVETPFNPKFKLIAADKIKFNSFVDCNMAEAWVGDTFRIFPGKYGEDPV
jgi:hypothetical protein